MAKVRWRVTKTDIKNGKNGKGASAICCPVALSVRRLLNDPKRGPGHKELPHVGVSGFIYVEGCTYRTSRAVARFVRRFDAGLPVEPFTFEVTI
jgi:hypothetical protein